VLLIILFFQINSNNSVKSISVTHDIDNMSDHDPLFLELELIVTCCKLSSPKNQPKPSWNKATSEHIAGYKRLLCDNLHDVVLPTGALLCHNLCCHDHSHVNHFSTFVSDISRACLVVGAASLPYTGCSGTRSRMPGWTEYVAPVRDKAITCDITFGLNLVDLEMVQLHIL